MSENKGHRFKLHVGRIYVKVSQNIVYLYLHKISDTLSCCISNTDHLSCYFTNVETSEITEYFFSRIQEANVHLIISDCRLLWEFIYQLLEEKTAASCSLVAWETDGSDLVFRILNPTGLADMWGQQKNRSNMTYEKLSRALRYYYRMNIIKKVQGKRLTYK